MAPALRLRRLNLVETLAEDGNAPVGGGTRSRIAKARLFIIAGQVAIACVLLVAASLLGRSVMRIAEVDRGYEPAGLITARLSLPSTMYTAERRFAAVTGILERLAQTGGVEPPGELALPVDASLAARRWPRIPRRRHANLATRRDCQPRIRAQVSRGCGRRRSRADGSRLPGSWCRGDRRGSR